MDKRANTLRQSFIDTIYRLTLMVEFRDSRTASHLKRVSHYTALLARLLGFPDDEVDIMFHASPMHDIGKIGISDAILQNTGKLTAEQFEIMKTHTTIGARVLSGSDSAYLKSAGRFALYHHETWDGSGYPQGLWGEEIPVEGRIMLIVDRYDALRSARAYKPSFSHEDSIKILLENSDWSVPSNFDPEIFQTFLDNHARFDNIYEECRDK